MSKLREELSVALGLSLGDVNRIVARSPYSYKIYQIKKRSGGWRTIAQPARETKLLQYWLIDKVFSKLLLHQCATAYRNNSGILHNANAHKNNSYLVKFDFKNFFPSIKYSDLISFFTNRIGDSYSPEDIEAITRLVCIKFRDFPDKCLSIGAPSSPILSNSILFEFDCQISAWCDEHQFTYTRYADDLTFSTNAEGLTNTIEPMLVSVLEGLKFPRINLNTKKTIHLSKAHSRRVTGLVITNEGKISIGRGRKREISALIHRYTLNSLSREQKGNLQGLLGYAKGIEPAFFVSMCKKYGSVVIDEILQFRTKEIL